MDKTELDLRCQSGARALQAGDLLSAQGIYAETLRLEPNCKNALVNLAMLFLQTNRLTAALAMSHRAVKAAPCFEAFYNHAWILATAGRFEEAEHALEIILRNYPEHQLVALAWHAMGMCRYQLGRWSDSIAAFDEEMRHELTEEQRVAAIDQRGLALLGAGRYTEGLIDNKIRWSVLVAHPLMHSSIPQWEGQPLEGKHICVLHEQGDGDTFQFVRFVPRLKERGAARVTLSVPDRMHDLFRSSGLADDIIGIRDMPEADYICPMLTVPAYFNLGPDNIPAGIPYLSPPGATAARRSGGPVRVGLVWAGKPMYAADGWRSMPLDTLLPLLDVPGCTFTSLQVGERSRDLHETGLCGWVSDSAPLCTDWGKTARVMRDLDVVVSVDTAPAHLAGALGVRTLLMIPEAGCWRWGDHDRFTSPWYPTMNIFRQERQGDWAPVISGVRQALVDLTAVF
jgi:hypothetical protein